MDLKSFALGSVVRERWAPLKYTYVDTNYWYIKNNVLHLFPSEIPADADASGTVELNNIAHHDRPWEAYKGIVTKIVADNSNSGLRSMMEWFMEFTALTDIGMLSNLDTRRVSRFDATFYGCTALTDVVVFFGASPPISQYPYRNYDNTFRDCSNIVRVKICDQIDRIGWRMFEGCTSMQSIEIPDSVKRIDDNAFTYCSSLESIIIPNSVTSILSNVFANSGLKTISLPNSITEISNRLFHSCSGLRSVFIPNGVTSIGSRAFESCYSLTYLAVPGSVTSIGDYAFQINGRDQRHYEYHFYSTTPPSAGTAIFGGLSPSLTDVIIYVPAASLSAYQRASGWSSYASYMVGE